MFKAGTQVTFKPTISAQPVVGTYLGVVQPYELKHHAIQVPGYSKPNWIRVGSELEDSIEPVFKGEDLALKTQALDQIAEAYNSSTTTPQDIVNAVAKALESAGYELRF